MPVSVLVVDDSSTVRTLLTRLLQTDPDLQVCGSAADGETALLMVQSEKPDVVALDLNMPGLNGFEVTRKIMEVYPLPIVIVTTDEKSTANPFKLLEAGAVAVVTKPGPPGHPNHKEDTSNLIQTLKALKGINVRWRRKVPLKVSSAPVTATDGEMSCIAIGASTGGPQILKQIIDSLSSTYPVPVMVTQHIAKGFSASFVKWLSIDSKVKIVLAEEGMKLQPGYVYVAPDDLHMGLTDNRTIALSSCGREYGMRPAIAYMFRSLERTVGKNCVAIVLTGMGKDGASEMAALRKVGAVTIAQDRATSLIHGMPGQAIALGAAAHVLSPEQIIDRLKLFDKGVSRNSTAAGAAKRP
jgi:two-component system, chemotaxis family, protein-glutamate methylesterase/glutaminase